MRRLLLQVFFAARRPVMSGLLRAGAKGDIIIRAPRAYAPGAVRYEYAVLKIISQNRAFFKAFRASGRRNG